LNTSGSKPSGFVTRDWSLFVALVVIGRFLLRVKEAPSNEVRNKPKFYPPSGGGAGSDPLCLTPTYTVGVTEPISNGLTVIEQITYLLFVRRLDELHTAREKKANLLKKPIEEPIFLDNDREQSLRWSRFKDLGSPEKIYELFRDKVFPFIKETLPKRQSNANPNKSSESAYAKFMKDAVFVIPTPSLFARVVDMLNDIPMEDRDTKGDLYEYLLSKIASAGTNGQFRTPRHIIKLMVDLMQPKPDDIVNDPACGTCGFLVETGEYLRRVHPEIFHDEKKKAHFNNKLFCGTDFDASMLRVPINGHSTYRASRREMSPSATPHR
jgi:type I restriction enzyme M protein